MRKYEIIIKGTKTMKRWGIFAVIVIFILAFLTGWVWDSYKEHLPNAAKPVRVSVTHVSIMLSSRHHQLLAVPSISVVPLASGYTVYTIVDSKAKAVPVTLGEEHGSMVAILSGLEENEQVITSGASHIHPGMFVEIEPPQ